MSKKILGVKAIEEFRKRLASGSQYKPVDIPGGYSGATKIPVDQRILEDINKIGILGPKNKIVIHATAGGYELSGQDEYLLYTCNWGGTKWKGYKNGKPDLFDGNKRNSLTHYTVFDDGQIAQHANEKQWLEHVMKDNENYIGIEHHFRYTKEAPTKEMYKASAKLVKDICQRHGIELSDPSQVIVQHDPNADPGKYWDWNHYFKLLKDNTYNGTPLSKEGIDGFLAKNTGKEGKAAHPNPSLAPGKVQQESIQDKQGEESDYTNEDIENGILAYFLPEIVDYREKKTSGDERTRYQENNNETSKYENLVYFDTNTETPFFNNLLFGKKLRTLKDYNKLTNLEISNFVPFVELYLIQEKREVLFPFDDYTNKAKLENILNDPTSRGGNIGIKKVSWNSLATNNDNLAQFTVKVSFLIQDIEEIEKERNGISLLDFLYPAGSRDPDVYNAKNHNIKMKAGWCFKKNRTTEDIESKITEKLLQETIYLSLYKHSFEFDEKDGTVTLDIEYIGMTETEASNVHEKNILDETNFITGETSTELKAWKNTLEEFIKWVGVAKEGPKDLNINRDGIKGKAIKDSSGNIKFQLVQDAFLFKKSYYMSKAEERQECKVAIKEKIKTLEGTIKKEKAGTFGKLLQQLNKDQRMLVLSFTQDELDIFKNLSHTSMIIDKKTKAILSKQIEKVTDSLKNVRGKELLSKTKFNENLEDNQNFVTDDGKLKLSEFSNIQNKNSLFIPFVYLQDILHLLYQWVYGEKTAKNAKTRLCLGSFSFLTTNITQTNNPNSGDSQKTQQFLEYNSKLLRKFSNERKYGNIGNIPISIKSFASWYNDKIINGDIQKMSFHEMLRDIMFSLVPQNIEPQIFPWGPSVSLNPFIIYDTIPKVDEIENWFANPDPKSGGLNTVTGEEIKNSPWANFSKYKNLNTTQVKQENAETINYIFITSKFEVNKKLKGNPNEDIENNILHFYVGEDKGLVKNIKFKREDNKQLDAANIVKANKEQSRPMIIRQMYQLEMSMFGNTLFYPGNLIHVAPSYPGSRLNNKTLYKIGLGGYYRILRLKHVLGQDGFTTNVEAKWEASGIDKLRKEDREMYEEIADSSEEGGSPEGLQTEEKAQQQNLQQAREIGRLKPYEGSMK